MSLSLFLLCAAASAAVAFSTSALLGVGLSMVRSRLDGLTAAAQARVLFGIALLPALVCLAVMTAALAPSFGWIVDHCPQSADPHHHPHICAHHVSVLPAWPLVLLGTLLLIRLAVSAARLLRGGVAVLSTKRVLTRTSNGSDMDGVRILPLEEPQAFVVGALSPELFITQGLLSDAHREHLAPALSHERAHLRRRDPLRRAVASVALGFHLPGVAAWLERRLSRAHELAADEEAALEIRSPERVARALVSLTRAQRRAPRMAMAFGASDVEARVASLLDPRPRQDQPRKAVLIGGVALLFALVGLMPDAVHHGVEIVLGLLSG